jgi:hypothetical protein
VQLSPTAARVGNGNVVCELADPADDAATD